MTILQPMITPIQQPSPYDPTIPPGSTIPTPQAAPLAVCGRCRKLAAAARAATAATIAKGDDAAGGCGCKGEKLPPLWVLGLGLLVLVGALRR